MGIPAQARIGRRRALKQLLVDLSSAPVSDREAPSCAGRSIPDHAECWHRVRIVNRRKECR